MMDQPTRAELLEAIQTIESMAQHCVFHNYHKVLGPGMPKVFKWLKELAALKGDGE